MADKFLDPLAQANADKLNQALQTEIGLMEQLKLRTSEALAESEGVSKEALAARQEELRAVAGARTPPGQLQETLAGLRQQVALESEAGALIAKQIQLEAQLAKAVRETVAARGSGAVPVGAAERVQAAVGAEERAAAAARAQAEVQTVRAPSPAGIAAGQVQARLAVEEQAAAAARAQAAAEVQAALAGRARPGVQYPTAAGPVEGPPTGAGPVGVGFQAQADEAAKYKANLQAVYDQIDKLTPETEKLTAAQAELLAVGQAQAKLSTAQTGRIGGPLQEGILYSAQSDNALKRHGALTTEFINAAARGQVTLREFGDQVGSTIGKFAGWTGAAAAVYGAYNAVTLLARGAIDSSNTVGQLHRTINGLNDVSATQAVVRVAHDTNTSMKEAGDAVFAFSRTFPHLGDATTAASLALKAFQLDGVSVADQVKAQTAISQQFGITAGGLAPIYDELAAGQREFNARITDQIPLLQRSASAVKNAGGDLRTFIELSTIALRTTQLSGSQLGTAFLRSAATFLNPATTKGQADRQVLASLGIDTNQNYTDLITSALERAATLSPAQRQKLSLAVFGPLLGGRTAGFFTGGPQLLGDVQKQLAPDTVKGTFLDEFSKELATSQQQLKALGNNLQQFGAELGASGLGAPIGLLVHGLNEALTVSTNLLKVFSALPAPIRDLAGLGIGALGLRAVTQRVGLTGVPFFGRSQEAVDSAQVASGLHEQTAFFTDQRTSTARALAVQRLATQEAELARNAAVEGATREKQIAAQEVYQRALARNVELEVKLNSLQAYALASKEQQIAFQAARDAGLGVEAAAAQAGVDYRLTTLDRGNVVPNPVVPVDRGAAPNPIVPVAGGSSQARFTIDSSGVASDAQAAEEKATSALERAKTAVSGSLSKIGGGLTSLGSSIVGFLNPWVAGLIIAPIVFDVISQAQHKLDEALKLASQEPGGGAPTPSNDLARIQVEQTIARTEGRISDFSTFLLGVNAAIDKGGQNVVDAVDKIGGRVLGKPADYGLSKRKVDIHSATDPLQQQLDGVNKKISEQSDFLTQVANQAGAIVSHPLQSLSAAAAAIVGGPGGLASAGSELPGAQDAVSPLKAQQQQIQQLIAARARAFYGGKQATNLPADTINAQVQLAFQNYSQGLSTVAELQSSLARSLREASPKFNSILSGAQQSDLRAAIADVRSRLETRTAQVRAQLTLLSGAQLDKQIVDYSNMLKVFGGTSSQGQDALKHLGTVLGELARRTAVDPHAIIDKSGNTNLDKFAQAESQITAAIQEQVQADLQFGLRTAKTRQQRAAAYAKAAAETRQYEVGVRADIAAQAKHVADLERKVAIERAEQSALTVTGKSVAAAVQATIDTINGLNGFMQGVVGNVGVLIAAAGGSSAQLKQSLGQLKQGKGELAILQGLQNELNKGAEQAIQGYQGLSDKAATPPKKRKRTTPASEDPFELTRLRREIQEARDQGDPVKSATDAVALAQDEVKAARNEHERLQGILDLTNAENQLNTAIEDRKQAYFTYLESTTRDPVRQAADELKAASAGLAFATKNDGVGSQGYYDAKAKQNDAKHKLADAQLSQKEDNIQFALDVNKISVQAAIEQYDALLKLKNLTTAQREDLKRKIYALQHGSSADFSDLNLGTIKLPTPYEIRRAVLAATQQGASAIVNHNSVAIYATDERSASAVGVVMDRYVSGTGKSISRARGAR